MKNLSAGALLGVAVLSLSGCQASDSDQASRGGASDPQSLVVAGRFDEALSRLEGVSGSGAELLRGQAWAGKALDAAPVGSSLGPDAQRARQAFEAVLKAEPANAPAQLGLARLLAPHVIAGAAPPAAPEPEGAPEAEPTPEPAPAVAASDAVRAFRAATADESLRDAALAELVALCRVAGCLDEADEEFRELLAAFPQNRTLPATYGDFLAADRGDREAALAQYGVALIWSPKDPELRARVADIHISQGFDHLEWGEYPQAETWFESARPYIASTNTPQWARLQQGVERLDRIRPQRR